MNYFKHIETYFKKKSVKKYDASRHFMTSCDFHIMFKMNPTETEI